MDYQEIEKVSARLEELRSSISLFDLAENSEEVTIQFDGWTKILEFKNDDKIAGFVLERIKKEKENLDNYLKKLINECG